MKIYEISDSCRIIFSTIFSWPRYEHDMHKHKTVFYHKRLYVGFIVIQWDKKDMRVL